MQITKALKNQLPPKTRSATWVKQVKDSPCCMCGAPPPSDIHHLGGSFGSLKTSDIFSVSLCRGCHSKLQGDAEMKDELLFKWCMQAHRELVLIYGVLDDPSRLKLSHYRSNT